MEASLATPRKRWLNEAEWARQEAVSKARRARSLIMLNSDGIHDKDALHMLLNVTNLLWEIETTLNAVNGGKDEDACNAGS